MRTEKIVYTPEVIMPSRKKQEDTVTLTIPKSTAKAAGMLAASMLALASMAKADVKHEKYCGDYACETCKKDLTIDSPAISNKAVFAELVKDPGVKDYARVDANTLRYVYDYGDEVANGNGMVLDLVLDGNSYDVNKKGYTVNDDLFPQTDKPLKNQKYLSLAEYSEKVLPRYQGNLLYTKDRLAEKRAELERCQAELTSTQKSLDNATDSLNYEKNKNTAKSVALFVSLAAFLALMKSKIKSMARIEELQDENDLLKQEIIRMEADKY